MKPVPFQKLLSNSPNILETVHSQKVPLPERCWTGRPPKSRRGIFNAFVAKAFLKMPTTLHLVERLQSDHHLRLICGFESRNQVPSESVFSRVFSEFAKSQLPRCVHSELVKNCCSGEISGQISRDATAIEAREKPERKKKTAEQPMSVKKRKGRPRKGEPQKIKEPSRVQKQKELTLDEMLKDLPTACNCGSKKNSQGFTETWIGYKLHIDTADKGIPISAILTSASLHDSQVAIPLATMSAGRVQNFYECMDSAYDQPEIADYSRQLNHVPLIDVNPRRNARLKSNLESEEKARTTLNWEPAEAIRYNARSGAERTNARLKDEFGGRTGHTKVYCHLMFGILTLATDQLMRLIT